MQLASHVIKWGVQDSNLRRHCHQIYSLTPLTARETPLANPGFPYDHEATPHEVVLAGSSVRS